MQLQSLIATETEANAQWPESEKLFIICALGFQTDDDGNGQCPDDEDDLPLSMVQKMIQKRALHEKRQQLEATRNWKGSLRGADEVSS